MSDKHEQPQHGGSYVRGKDGKLTLQVEHPVPAPPADDAKTAARSGASPKKEK